MINEEVLKKAEDYIAERKDYHLVVLHLPILIIKALLEQVEDLQNQVTELAWRNFN